VDAVEESCDWPESSSVQGAGPSVRAVDPTRLLDDLRIPTTTAPSWARAVLALERPRSRTPAPSGRLAAMSLLTDLDAFFTDHHQCGDLDAGVRVADGLVRLPVRREDRSTYD
jgi:hypothetical protein